MMRCTCSEMSDIKINSWKQYEEIKKYFEEGVQAQMYSDIPVTIPYHIGYSSNGNSMKWFANKWYKCAVCSCVWEFVYPDFPAQGNLKKINIQDNMEGN